MKALKVKDLIKALQDPIINLEDCVAVSLDNRLDKIALVEETGYMEVEIFLHNTKGVQNDYIEKSVAKKVSPAPIRVIIITGSVVKLGESEKFEK